MVTKFAQLVDRQLAVLEELSGRAVGVLQQMVIRRLGEFSRVDHAVLEHFGHEHMVDGPHHRSVCAT